MSRHTKFLLAFFGLANLISWVIWLPLVLRPELAAPGAPLYPLFYLGGLGPVSAAFIVTARTSGRPGIKKLLGRMLGRGAKLRWIVIGATLPLIIFLLAVLYTALTTGRWIPLSELGHSAKFPGLGLLGILTAEILFFGFGEETGWRGFALPHLQAKFNALTSTAILTAFWAAWHIPTFIFNSNMAHMGVGGTIGWVLSLFTGAVILTWLLNTAGGSILPVALFHGILDVVFISVAVAGRLDSFVGAVLTIFGIAILIVCGYKQLSRSKKYTA